MQIRNWAKFTASTKILRVQHCMLHRHAARDQVCFFLRFNIFAKTMPVTHAYLSHLLLRTPVDVTHNMMGRTWAVILGKSSNQAQEDKQKKNLKMKSDIGMACQKYAKKEGI